MTAGLTEQLEAWQELVIGINEIGRSLGVGDPYPFIINATVARKLQFVRDSIQTLVPRADRPPVD